MPDNRVVLGQPQPAAVLQLAWQTQAFGSFGGDDDERIGVLAVAVETRRTELRLAQRPFDQGRKGRGRAVEDQTVDAVRRAVAIQHGERAVDEPGIGGGRGRGRSGGPLARRGLLCGWATGRG
ncbi:hypothetical protein Srufu_077260 [Streptomyces libani subsp. rufus]|nr:hypothetical protein Srufu_077260 [Streptomyces libani subsp. rufus]